MTNQLLLDSTTTTPGAPMCAFCDCVHPEHVYFMDRGYICDYHLARCVQLSAEAVFPDCVSFGYNLGGILDTGGRY